MAPARSRKRGDTRLLSVPGGRTSASKKGKSKDEIKAEITEQEPENTPSSQSDDQEDEEISVKTKGKGKKPTKRGKVKEEIAEQEPEKTPSSQSDDQEDEEISVKTKGKGKKPTKRGKVKEETTDSDEAQDEEPKRKRTKRAPAKPKGSQRAARGKKSMKESSTEPSEDEEIEVKQVKKKVASPRKKNKKGEDTPVPRPIKYESLGDGPPPVPSTGRKYMGSHVSAAGGIWNAFENAEECSSKSFAIFLRNQRQWNAKPLDEETVEKWKEIGKDFPPHLILPHGSYLMNLGSPVPETLEKSRAMLVDELQRCQRLGIPHYNFHPGSTTGKISREECCKLIAESINLAHSQTKGVICVLENMSCQGFTIGGDLHELRLIIEHVKDKSRVGVCLDTCHSHAAGYDLSTEEGFEELLEDFEKIIGWQFLRGLHINDSKGEVGDHLDRHENIGKGSIGVEGFFRVMNCEHFNDLPLILETPWTSNAGYANEVKALTSLILIEK
ncbi:probable endonuclease 4 isoform X3 [Eriocheir sinensis]|uniref:probable endonuclease 4 isoform X3 n=1 Tax=Eriocheir sinensis TaxID=95602 RepID=UPI0021C82DFB|nr:probable endonuclease 4 isoform X3 [Eriocheir sinensis]